MVCLPIDIDQPLIAYKIADEIGLGVRLDYYKLDSNDLRGAVHKILKNKSYYERIDRYSKMSRNYVGYKKGYELIYSVLDKKSIA